MDGLLIKCDICGGAYPAGVKHTHDLPLRDDQTLVKGNRRGHYGLQQRRVFLVPKPAAGADWIVTVPNQTRWRIDCLQAQFVTSAAIANRVVHIIVTDGQGNSLYNVPASGNQVAATTAQYSAATDSVQASFDNATVLMLPQPLSLLQGWTIQSLTTAIDVADQWSKIALLVRERLYF